ncbi:kinase-like domain-containing protein [Armillaria borealis]|uniref:non-specific serine/threonine protein kinase n=1 Tax=Armillaria borealis TaxID=47425 RepID=A0AA39MKW8_9AGAR|nr:kinase-like domain-containing protein [Armillaria borealis]
MSVVTAREPFVKRRFATVYKGYHEETHVQVAIKAVKRDNPSAKLFDNLQSEIQIFKSLCHLRITRLTDIVHSEHYIYLIMEYYSGGDLTGYIKKRGRVETLEYIPSPGAAPQYYPHPRTGSLDLKRHREERHREGGSVHTPTLKRHCDRDRMCALTLAARGDSWASENDNTAFEYNGWAHYVS